MLDAFYQLIINPVMVAKAVLLALVALIVIQSDYFAHRQAWKRCFLVACSIAFVGLAGDIMDGSSTLDELRVWALLRHVGITILLYSALGMHWDKFAPVLFKGSKLFDNRLMRKLFRYEGK